jgi:hypothetical protein
MRTVVIGEAGGGIAYNPSADRLRPTFGLQLKACHPYRAKAKGKVERPYCYNREDFFLARSLLNLDDLNVELQHWLDTVANPRVHDTTQKRSKKPSRQKNYLGRVAARLVPRRAQLERPVSHEGMVSVGGNFYTVPDATRKRIDEVRTLADEVQILGEGTLIAIEPVLDGAGSGGLRWAIARCALSSSTTRGISSEVAPQKSPASKLSPPGVSGR